MQPRRENQAPSDGGGEGLRDRRPRRGAASTRFPIVRRSAINGPTGQMSVGDTRNPLQIIELEVVARDGIEPSTRGFSGQLTACFGGRKPKKRNAFFKRRPNLPPRPSPDRTPRGRPTEPRRGAHAGQGVGRIATERGPNRAFLGARRGWENWEPGETDSTANGVSSRTVQGLKATKSRTLLIGAFERANTGLSPPIRTRGRGRGRPGSQEIANLCEQCHLKIDFPIPADQLSGDKEDNYDYEYCDQCARAVVRIAPKLTADITGRHSASPYISGMTSNPGIGFRRLCPASRYEGPYDHRTFGSFSPPSIPARAQSRICKPHVRTNHVILVATLPANNH